jgi:hypothetical protein
MGAEFTPRDLPEPKWQLLDQTETRDGSKKIYHVKLAQPHIARLLSGSKYVEVEYVHVNVTHKNVTDSAGSFTFNETAITASDEAGKLFESYLYYAHRALALEEALFSIGEA